jgi:hypothetical protein
MKTPKKPLSFTLSVFLHTSRLDVPRSKGVGPWPVDKIATIAIEFEAQEMVFLNAALRISSTPPSGSLSAAAPRKRSAAPGTS